MDDVTSLIKEAREMYDNLSPEQKAANEKEFDGLGTDAYFAADPFLTAVFVMRMTQLAQEVLDKSTESFRHYDEALAVLILGVAARANAYIPTDVRAELIALMERAEPPAERIEEE